LPSLSELNLPIDDNPDGTADSKQALPGWAPRAINVRYQAYFRPRLWLP
jgi:hypothetical protein